jgi:hypothetical protein
MNKDMNIEEQLKELNEVLKVILNNEFDISKLASEENVDAFFKTPITHKNNIDSIIKNSVKNDFSQSDLMNLVNLLPKMLKTLEKMRDDIGNHIQKNSFYEYYFNLIINAPNGKKVEIDNEINTVLEKQLNLEKVIPGISSNDKRPFQEILDVMIFEQRAKYYSDSLLNTIELNYTPFLRSVLNITKILDNRPTSKTNELGKLQAECREYWKETHTRFMALIINSDRIFRNSEAHRNTKYNLDNETILFINKSKDKEEILGPMTIDNLVNLFLETQKLVISIYDVYRYVRLFAMKKREN